jgi:hypothetical protein
MAEQFEASVKTRSILGAGEPWWYLLPMVVSVDFGTVIRSICRYLVPVQYPAPE